MHRLIETIGSGNFGSVSKGLWTSESGVVEVAVKTLTDSANTVKFLQEAAIMVQFKHPNILTLHGVVTTSEPVSWKTLKTTLQIYIPSFSVTTENDCCGIDAQRRPKNIS